jgi:predicted MFS family arabinose efflux permease
VNRQTDRTVASAPGTTSASQPRAGHRTTLTLLMLAYTLSMCDRMILSILFPDIKAEFGLTNTQLGLLGGISFALFYATMGLPIARLSDQYSRKWIIITSLVIFSLMTAFSGLAAGFISLLILRDDALDVALAYFALVGLWGSAHF